MPKIGIDVRELKHEHEKALAFIGNIDVAVISRWKRELKAEACDKLLVVRQGSGLYQLK